MKLAVLATIFSAFKFVWHQRIQFYSLALPAVVILSILSTLADSILLRGIHSSFQFDLLGLQVQSSEEPLGFFNVSSPWAHAAGFGVWLIMVVVFPLYSVAWHRLFLAPHEDITILKCYVCLLRHWSFLWLNIRIFILIIPIGILGFLITLFSLFMAPIVGILLTLFVIVCYARFSMWLPAAALDQYLTFSGVLNLTKGHGWQLAAIMIVMGITTGVLDGVATIIIANASSSISVVGELTQNLLTNFALFFITYAGTAVGITALSIVYRKLTECITFSAKAP